MTVAKPWQTIDKIDKEDNVLELRKRGDRDFLLLVNGRVLMNSSANRSEVTLGEHACRLVADRPKPRVLIGGLGMGFTLRAALDALPAFSPDRRGRAESRHCGLVPRPPRRPDAVRG